MGGECRYTTASALGYLTVKISEGYEWQLSPAIANELAR